jgi:hypothetical protein
VSIYENKNERDHIRITHRFILNRSYIARRMYV